MEEKAHFLERRDGTSTNNNIRRYTVSHTSISPTSFPGQNACFRIPTSSIIFSKISFLNHFNYIFLKRLRLAKQLAQSTMVECTWCTQNQSRNYQHLQHHVQTTKTRQAGLHRQGTVYKQLAASAAQSKIPQVQFNRTCASRKRIRTAFEFALQKRKLLPVHRPGRRGVRHAAQPFEQRRLP